MEKGAKLSNTFVFFENKFFKGHEIHQLWIETNKEVRFFVQKKLLKLVINQNLSYAYKKSVKFGQK